jgi:transcriptional regulator with XRE-family HTH domain
LYQDCDMSTYGERLREARKEARLRQKDLAAKTGLSQTTISDAERGRNSGSGATAKIAAALGVEPLWLADGRGPKRRDEDAATPAGQQEEEQITITDAVPPPDDRIGLFAVEHRTIARPQLTDDECVVLDGFRIASQEVRNEILSKCLLELHLHGQRAGERQKKA